MSKHLPDVCIFLVCSCKSQRFYMFKDRIGPVWLNVISKRQLILRPAPKWRAAGCQFSRCSAASPFGKPHSLSWSPWRISEGQIETETTGCPIRSQQLVTGCKQLRTYTGWSKDQWRRPTIWRDFALQMVLQRLTQRLVPHCVHTVQEFSPFQAGIDLDLDPVKDSWNHQERCSVSRLRFVAV